MTEETTEGTTPTTSTAKSSARARAEARRKRILEGANDRMGIVSGEAPSAPKPVPVAADDTVDDAAADAGGGDGGGGEDGETPKAKSGGASKYAQMRRRRYKKAANTTAATATETKEETTAEADAEKKDEKEEATTTATTETKEEEKEETKETEEETTTTTTETKKKYMGVAKMRRMRLHEKKLKEEQQEEASSSSSSSPPKKKLPKSLSTVARSSTPRAPIVFQLLTVALLFLVGLDIGSQHCSKWDGASYPFAINQMEMEVYPLENGIGAARSLMGGGEKKTEAGAGSGRDKLLDELNRREKEGAAEEDEFADDVPKNKPHRDPLIDPIFRVDLDLLTAGSGPIMFLARRAVEFHRFLLQIFFYFPQSIVLTLLSLPQSLMNNPPVIFVLAVLIRYIGRHVFGASVPDFDALSSQNPEGKEEDKKKDILSMMTESVKGQFKDAFPTMVLLWNMFNDARTDIYVVLCGLFVGLALPVHLNLGSVGGEGKDEL